MSAATSAGTRCRADRILAGSLRLFGGIDLLAMVACLMPLEWLRTAHAWCGFGEFPSGPLPEYLARATSLHWAMHGALLLCLASDVGRYADAIRCVAWLTVVWGVLLFVVGVMTALPVWWVLVEGPLFAATGCWCLWWLSGRHG